MQAGLSVGTVKHARYHQGRKKNEKRGADNKTDSAALRTRTTSTLTHNKPPTQCSRIQIILSLAT